MGILGLSKLIADIAPFAIKESDIKNYFGKRIFYITYIIIFLVLEQKKIKKKPNYYGCKIKFSKNLFSILYALSYFLFISS